MKILYAYSFFLFFAAVVSAQTIERLQVTVDRIGGGMYEFYAENGNFFPMQVELNFTQFDNMSADCDLPYVGTVMPGKHKIFSIFRTFNDIPGNFEYRFNTRIGAYPVTHNDNAVYLLPIAKGKSTKVVSYDLLRSRTPGKIMWGFEMEPGDVVYASRGGVVCQQAIVQTRDGRIVGDNTITILHDDLTFGRYELLADESFMVAIGDTVEAGTPIARAGEARLSTTPQIRFWVYYVNARIDSINANQGQDIHSYINPVFMGSKRKSFTLEGDKIFEN